MSFELPVSLLLETDRLYLAIPKFHNYYVEQLAGLFESNRDHFKASMPTMYDDQYSVQEWENRIKKLEKGFVDGTCYGFLMIEKTKELTVIGQITYDGIVQGIFKACYLGYRIGQKWEGRGMMQEALKETNSYIFSTIKLHRIMANYRPHNIRSAKLLAKLGFRVEGCARDYLFIDGKWRDHILAAKINDIEEFVNGNGGVSH